MYVSYYCKNQISVRQISSKTRVGEREVAFPSSRNPKFSRGACPQSLLGGSWLPPPPKYSPLATSLIIALYVMTVHLIVLVTSGILVMVNIKPIRLSEIRKNTGAELVYSGIV